MKKERLNSATEERKEPYRITDAAYHYDAFENGMVLHEKRKQHLPAMGWNSWNAFGSGNTEALTKEMAEALVSLGLADLGYRYVVLDDGCYKAERVNGRLSNEEEKFPSGFRSLADFLHAKGLKFGMYNDIGTNLCAGAAVGTCFYEEIDANSYVEWDIDFIKVDNCYYLWDNATFSDAANAKYVYAPNIRSIKLLIDDFALEKEAVKDGVLFGAGAKKTDKYVTFLGTFDGTGPEISPLGYQSAELRFLVTVPKSGKYDLLVEYATGQKVGVGAWLQVAVQNEKENKLYFDDSLAQTPSDEAFAVSLPIPLFLEKGENEIRLMNHRRQENTLFSYALLLEKIKEKDPKRDLIFSICEWGKTQPQNWGYKVGDSWRILNDITFQVGAQGDWGVGAWRSDYTTGITAQYNKAVIMDEFAGLSKGWNDPDMMVIGMNNITLTMSKTHMAMWCMLNAPLMLGLDLRRIKKGDAIYQIIANEDLINLNQDPLGIQAKRIAVYKCDRRGEEAEKEYNSLPCPDTTYIRDGERVDILAKPLFDGSVALSFLNISETRMEGAFCVDVDTILSFLGHKMRNKNTFANAGSYQVTDLWTKESYRNDTKVFAVHALEPCANVTVKVTAMQ